MMSKKSKFISVIIVQVILIFIIVFFKLLILANGTPVMLRIEPIDPRDPLRGDFVTFQYTISNIPSYRASGEQMKNGDDVYVILKESGKYWTATKIQKERPKENELFIKGNVRSGGMPSKTSFSINQRTNSSDLRIIYGIEEYFIPEGEGRNFSFRNKEASAQVVIDAKGNAVLKQIYIDNEPWP